MVRFSLLLIGLLLSGCAWKVVPPAAVKEPLAVCLADYSRHSRLLLPREPGWVEYGFGDWKYYALGEDSLCNGVSALLGSSQATLGRRDLSDRPTAEGLGAERMVCFDVEAGRARALRRRLAERFEAGAESRIWNGRQRMHFVKDGASYSLFRNSNHQVGVWLEELGCEVRGAAVLSNFRVERKEGSKGDPSGELRPPDGSR